MRPKRRAPRAVAGAMLVVALGCGGGGAGGSTGPAAPMAATPVLTRLVVALPAMTIVVGATVVASAIGLDQGGKPIAISSPAWSTGTPNVATISADGVVTAHASGQTQVVATVGGTDGRATLTVLDVRVSAVSVAPAVTTLLAGATRQLAVTVLDDDGRVVSGRPIAWSSSDSAKVTVSATGVITGVATGTATVTASVGGKSTAATVSVAAPGELATIEISARTPNLVVGDTLQLTATLRDAEGTVLAGREITWVTSVAAGSGVASLSGSGLLTAESVGTVVVEAVSGGQRGALAITVRARVDESIVVTFANPLPNELIGDTLRVVAGVRADRPLQQVVAVIEGKEYPLVLTPTNRSGVLWMGWIDVTFQKYGPYALTVVATDETGAIGLAALTYQRDTRIGEVGGKLPPKNK